MDQITQNSKVVNLLVPYDISAGAHATAYVNMENYGHVDFVVSVGANGAGTKAVTLAQAQDTSGTSTAAIAAAGYQYNNVAALASSSIANDTLVKTTMSAGTFNIPASTDNLTYVIPVEGTDLNTSSSMTHVGIGVATTGAASLVSCVAILSEPRYASSAPPTALD